MMTHEWVGNILVDALPPIIDTHPTLGSSLRTNMGTDHLYELCVEHQAQEALQGCKEQTVKMGHKTTEYHEMIPKLNHILRAHTESEDVTKKSKLHTTCWEGQPSGNSTNAMAMKTNSSAQVVQHFALFCW